jgi:hypothetical protein
MEAKAAKAAAETSNLILELQYGVGRPNDYFLWTEHFLAPPIGLVCKPISKLDGMITMGVAVILAVIVLCF